MNLQDEIERIVRKIIEAERLGGGFRTYHEMAVRELLGLLGGSCELVPGFSVSSYRSTEDGALVVELEGHPPGDEDCESVRVYMNEGFAAVWVSVDDPRYGPDR